LCPSAILSLILKAQSVTGSWPWEPPPRVGTSLFMFLSSPWVWTPVAQVLLRNGGNDVVRFSAPLGAREAERPCEAVIKFTQYPLFKV